MDYTHLLVILSAFISIAGASAYIRDTLRGKNKPNRVSWFLWALLPLIGTAAALSANADIWATVRIFLAGFLPLLVFIASFINQQSYWKLTLFDYLCGLFSLLALVVWGVTDSPRLAILLAAVGDGFATIPTLSKAWKFPETETGISYLAAVVSVLLVIPSIPVWNIENSAFQIYLLIANALLLFCVCRKSINLRKNEIIMGKKAFGVCTAKTLLYLLLGLISSAVFGVLGGFLGAVFGDKVVFPSFGGAAEGYGAGAVFFAILGLSLGALLATFLLNKLFKEKQKYAELAVTAIITVFLGLLLYDYSMPTFILIIILVLPSAAITTCQHWEKLKFA